MTQEPLEAKSLVIVGGTTGLGLSAATACLEAGARVVVLGRNADNVKAAAEALGPGAHALVGDATDPESAPRAIAAALDAFGGFDGLYHVAGGSGRGHGDGPLEQISDEAWRFTVDLNLKSVFLSNRAAIRQFLKQRTGGSILNMSSTLAYSPSPRYFSTHAYAATKAAIIGMSRSAASYYASRDIRINVLAPALVETPMARRACETPEIMHFIASKQPLDGGRVGRPADADAAVVFFLSDASRFVTGQVLAVDGGWSVSEGQYAAPRDAGQDSSP